ncbi:peptidase C45 [Candidimonas sp. SYP-B2681]|uniref:C45 family autoproteolytic acyltransferase/hydolase n=1 Tax=Candidimonas sp. SYP-B2681 TaxID=2497686 RepID=UPI000F860525|nr:C45 family peptidase [Candidimonas sp. SYP-B2681]RTZ45671.1 peptidase C45 [Candidimonas sp. SYP-B2681]
MLSLIELSGTPFQIGHALGRFGAQAAHSYLISSSAWDSVMVWRNTNAARVMQALVQQHFPLIHEELMGLASGLELPAEDVFLWNCRGDVWSMAADGCTTIQLPSSSGPRISHNEDGDPGFAGYCGIGEFTPNEGPRFASFLYPASIPGHTFAVTEHGLAMTVNNLRSRRVTVGVPRMVLTRAMLNESSLDDAVELLNNTQRSGGFHLSLAQRGVLDLLSVEFNDMGVSVQTIEAPSLHANHVIHDSMCNFPQVITESSLHRQLRGSSLLHGGLAASPADIDPLAILADQANDEYPIYRDSPDDTDGENTMATADIHVGADQVTWQVYERPGQSSRFSLIDARLV